MTLPDMPSMRRAKLMFATAHSERSPRLIRRQTFDDTHFCGCGTGWPRPLPGLLDGRCEPRFNIQTNANEQMRTNANEYEEPVRSGPAQAVSQRTRQLDSHDYSWRNLTGPFTNTWHERRKPLFTSSPSMSNSS